MTNYNDGTIHGWNGGDCPVHPETLVKVWLRAGMTDEVKGRTFRWSHNGSGDIIAFQVVKEYVEPKVIWVNEYAPGTYFVYDDEDTAGKCAQPNATRIAVKYVEAIADAKEVKE